MARYRKIDTRIWNDEKFRALTDDGKLVFFFLLTHPHMTSIGAMRQTVPGLASEIGWPVERLSEGFEEACSKGMARHDAQASMIWLPKFIRYNAPENPNVLKAWASAVDLLPECDLTREAIQAVKDFAEELPEAFQKALPEVFRQPLRQPSLIQEPEPEQEPRAGEEQAAPPGEMNGTAKTLKAVNPITLKGFFLLCEKAHQQPIPDGDTIFDYAEKAGIPAEYLHLCWQEFRARHIEKDKRYKDWRAAFRGCVRDNWYKLWAVDREGAYFLTAAGKQAQKANAK